MNGRGYHTRYRQGRRRSSLLPVIIIVVSVLAVLFLLFLLIGNGLNKKMQEYIPDATTTETQSKEQKLAPASVGCFYLDVSAIDNNLSRLSSNGVSAVSFEARSSDNVPVYDSDVAKAFGKSCGTLSVSSLMSRARSRGMHVSAYFVLEFMKEKNADIRAAKLGYEAALVSELCSDGVDDVMVYAPDVTSENYEELIRFAQSVKQTNSDAKIGISVKPDIYSHQNAAVMIDALFEAFDIVGIDLSDLEEKDIDKSVEAALASNLYYILRYNARVILPSVQDTELAQKLTDALTSSNVQNYQYIK